MSEEFNPAPHLIKLKGKDYLEVLWRIVWLEKTTPHYWIDTEIVELTAQRCVCKARVSIYDNDEGRTDRRSAVGIGSETAADFADFVEKAQTKAIGRALAYLGFGTQFAVEIGGEAEAGRIVDSPVARPTEYRPTPTNGAPPERVPGGASKKQIGLIRRLAQDAGMDDIELHEFMQGETGKESSNDLSSQDASRLIEKLQPLANNPRD